MRLEDAKIQLTATRPAVAAAQHLTRHRDEQAEHRADAGRGAREVVHQAGVLGEPPSEVDELLLHRLPASTGLHAH